MEFLTRMTEFKVSSSIETECFMHGQRMYYKTVYHTDWEKEVWGTDYQCGKKSTLLKGTRACIIHHKYDDSGDDGDEHDEILETELE
jgi:hypothetical protein